jgi:predicted molibdopterin-dependent oxidoreductase YjgC
MELTASPGQSVAAALLAHSERITRTTRFNNLPRGIFCGIGACFDCLIVVNGQRDQRSCITQVRTGMQVETQHG